MTRGRRLWLARGVLASASLLLALGLGELLARALVPAGSNVRFDVWSERAEGLGIDHLASTVTVSDPERFWRLAPDVTLPDDGRFFRGVVSNSQGLREDHEISRSKAPDEIRVLFVGDSCTFGWGLKHDETFVDYVEQALSKRYSGPVECINAGVPGYSLFQGWRFLEREGFDYQPDLIVLDFGVNDFFRWDGRSDFEQYEAWQAVQPIRPLRWSRLCQLAWRTLHPIEPPPEGEAEARFRLSPEEFEATLDRIHDETRRRHIELLLLVWPYSWSLNPKTPPDARTRLQKVLYRYGTEKLEFGPSREPGHVDLVPLVRAMGHELPASDIFQDGTHSTALTNRQIAAVLLKRILPWFEARIVERRREAATQRAPG